MTYQIVDRKDSRALAEFLSREGQLLLPMLELIEQADPSRLRRRMAVDELIDVAGRATPVLERSEGIEAVLTLSAQELAGPKHPGKATGSDLAWHGEQPGVVPLAERKLRVSKPRLRRKDKGKTLVLGVCPRSLPQTCPEPRRECQAHKLRNILSKLPRGVQAEIKKQIHAVFYAKDYEAGVQKGRSLIEAYEDRYPRAMECLAKSLDECLTCLKLPEAHRRRVRTTNGLERLIEEARRRTKVQGVLGGEQAGLSLIYAVTVDVAKRRRGIRITPGDLEKLNVLRAEVAPPAKTA